MGPAAQVGLVLPFPVAQVAVELQLSQPWWLEVRALQMAAQAAQRLSEMLLTVAQVAVLAILAVLAHKVARAREALADPGRAGF
jgi:hypothetical protein